MKNILEKIQFVVSNNKSHLPTEIFFTATIDTAQSNLRISRYSGFYPVFNMATTQMIDQPSRSRHLL